MKTLEKGKLYQVHNGKDWIIAEYVSKSESRIVHGYRSTDNAKSWHEAAWHWWRSITGGSFRVRDKGIQVRDVTEESLSEIAKLRAEIERLGNERREVTKKLIDFCN